MTQIYMQPSMVDKLAPHPLEDYSGPLPVTRAEELRRSRRAIHLLVIHCSASRNCDDYTPEQLIRDHVRRGFRGCGYHYYITKDGTIYAMRPVDLVGAHVQGHNRHSIGICYEGGLDHKYLPADTRTPMQRQSLSQLIQRLLELHPNAYVVGHRDLSRDRNGDGVITPEEWTKLCPCFDAKLYNREWVVAP